MPVLPESWNELPEKRQDLWAVTQQLNGDYRPYGLRPRLDDDPDCSGGCIHFIKLAGDLGKDWGVCDNPTSHRAGLLTWEHQGCPQFDNGDREICLKCGNRFSIDEIIVDPAIWEGGKLCIRCNTQEVIKPIQAAEVLWQEKHQAEESYE